MLWTEQESSYQEEEEERKGRDGEILWFPAKWVSPRDQDLQVFSAPCWRVSTLRGH